MKEYGDLDKEKILEFLQKLKVEVKIKLEEKSLESKSFVSYLRSGGSIWYWMILITQVMTVIMTFIISEDSYPLIYVRNISGLVFVLFLPGYAFTKVFFSGNLSTKGSTRDLEQIEQIVLSVGTSLALVSIIGLLLYYSPWGLGLTPILFSLMAFTSIFATAALIREYRAKKNQFKLMIT